MKQVCLQYIGKMIARPVIVITLFLVCAITAETKRKENIETVEDLKEWKKLLRTRTNVLSVFAAKEKDASDVLAMLDKVGLDMRGRATVSFVDCSKSKKVCKSLKINASPYVIKHYQDGSFNKDYDRPIRKSSFISFLENPSGDAPWFEDETAQDIKHIQSSEEFYKFIRKEKKPILIMFYAPWCGHCKRLKPEFASAATRLKGQAVLAGMDVDTLSARDVKIEYNITGYPTVLYFKGGEMVYAYGGDRTEEGIVEWMKDPQPPPEKGPEPEEEKWSDQPSNVIHLTDETFDGFISTNPSVLVMFHAPWCGHCKALKPHFTQAADIVKSEEIPGILVAVDATSEKALAKKYEITGYPKLKYFQDGEYVYDYGFGRTMEALVQFMKEPEEPPPPEKEWSEIPSSVEHLTDQTFKGFLKKKKHVLTMFYAPWCGHCKAAKPYFTSAAEQFKDDRKSSFAAVDCTKFSSLCTSHGIKGYPTIVYFNYGKNSFKYMGPRTEEGFVDFMQNPSAFAPTNLDREEL